MHAHESTHKCMHRASVTAGLTLSCPWGCSCAEIFHMLYVRVGTCVCMHMHVRTYEPVSTASDSCHAISEFQFLSA